jgi:hypothetical protein
MYCCVSIPPFPSLCSACPLTRAQRQLYQALCELADPEFDTAALLALYHGDHHHQAAGASIRLTWQPDGLAESLKGRTVRRVTSPHSLIIRLHPPHPPPPSLPSPFRLARQLPLKVA